MSNSFIAILLLPFAGIYFIINLIWNAYWRSSPKIHLKSKVISVGNITAGGTGKTSLTIYLAGHFRSQGKSVAIVARGYARKSKKPIVINSMKSIGWQDCGDEPAVMARLLPGINIYIDSVKHRAAQRAAKDGHN